MGARWSTGCGDRGCPGLEVEGVGALGGAGRAAGRAGCTWEHHTFQTSTGSFRLQLISRSQLPLSWNPCTWGSGETVSRPRKRALSGNWKDQGMGP